MGIVAELMHTWHSAKILVPVNYYLAFLRFFKVHSVVDDKSACAIHTTAISGVSLSKQLTWKNFPMNSL